MQGAFLSQVKIVQSYSDIVTISKLLAIATVEC